MRLYKLTNQKDQTYGGCQWGKNVTHITDGKGHLCGPGFTHWYTSPLLAVMLNRIHSDFDPKTMHLWEGKGIVVKSDHGLKVGCVEATTVKRIKIPKITDVQKIAMLILCAQQTYQFKNDKDFMKCSSRWLKTKEKKDVYTGFVAMVLVYDMILVDLDYNVARSIQNLASHHKLDLPKLAREAMKVR